jgi:hypothetical protein
MMEGNQMSPLKDLVSQIPLNEKELKTLEQLNHLSFIYAEYIVHLQKCQLYLILHEMTLALKIEEAGKSLQGLSTVYGNNTSFSRWC